MSVIAAAMAIPAYYLTGIFTEKVGIESKIPCLLSAFLITFNVYCLRMIEDFMQNLAGTFFILVFLYFTTKWFENMKQLYPNGILAFLAFTCAIFCHVFTAALALALFGILFIFNLFIKAIKMRKFPKKEFLIIMILIILSLAIFILLIILYPTTITNFISRFKSFFNSIFNADSKINEIYRFGFLVFLNIPYILGIWCTFYFLSNNLRKNVSNRDIKSFPDKTYLAFSYIFLAILLFLLIIIPSTWQERFLLMAFLPIGLIIPLSIILILNWFKKLNKLHQKMRTILISIISIIFALSSALIALRFVPKMGPIITMGEYNELTIIANSYIPDEVNVSGIIFVSILHFGYWVEYILKMDYFTGNLEEKATNYIGKPIYGIFRYNMEQMPFDPNYIYPWNPFLPYSENTLIRESFNLPKSSQPPPPFGIVIFHGGYLEMRLLYYSNGTKA